MEHPKRHSSNPTISALLMYGTEPTLDAWLEPNGVADVYDAELLEVIPAEFRDEYEGRLRLNSRYERKFAEQTLSPEPAQQYCLKSSKNRIGREGTQLPRFLKM